MMRFDPFRWEETEHEFMSLQGRVRAKASAPSALYVEQEGYEVLHSFGTEWDFPISGEASIRVEGPDGVRVFTWADQHVSHKADGVVHTNIDRRPEESGSVLAVRAEMRRVQLELQRQRQLMRAEMLEERTERRRRREARKAEDEAELDESVPEDVEEANDAD